MKRREQSLHAFSFLQLQQNLKVITTTKENNVIKAEIIVKGNVRMVGFRTFIKNLADSLNIKGYAKS